MSEPITTVEELDALPVGSVVMSRAYVDASRATATRGAPESGYEDFDWEVSGQSGRYSTAGIVEALTLPLTLLYHPDAPVTAGAAVTREQVEAVLALHRRWTPWRPPHVIGADLCRHCRDEHGAYLAWPCPTAAALASLAVVGQGMTAEPVACVRACVRCGGEPW